MSEYQLAFSNVTEDQLRRIFKAFNRFMVLLFRLGLGSFGNGTKYGGYIMVIKHTGRKTGLTRHTPVNYATVDGDIYCTSGFGRVADWYLNIKANPQVEVWLPDGRWAGIAEDATGEENSAHHLRQVIIASGFAGPLFGVNPKKLSEDDLRRLLESYRLIRIRKVNALTGAGGPGELSWIWPLATFALLWLLLKRRRK
jgi:deazaflavin-dependent oxidoreductase (nitroreductase family)